MKLRNPKEKVFNVVVLIVYAILLVFIIYFHEPWYDEAQSWLIARDASYRDILFCLPHYEGHPPFWWLLLSIPAKLGMPYEVSLKTIQVLFAVIASYLILFRSPFPKRIRFLMPFTYFLFYQYGVQARPYSIMLCALCLCAIAWERRNEKPSCFCLTLVLLCMTSAYGILMSSGIAAVWAFEAIQDGKLFQNKGRLISMLVIFLIGVLSLIVLFPAVDSYANDYPSFQRTTEPVTRFLLFVFCFPSEAVFTSFADDIHIWYFMPSRDQEIIMCVISVLMWSAMILVGYKRKTNLYLLVPFFVLAVFAAFKYFCMHHVGIIFLLFLFYLWISWQTDGPRFWNKTVQLLLNCFMITGLCISIFWSVYSSFVDIKEDVSYGRELSDYYLDEDLAEYVSVVTWQQERDEYGELLYENTHILHFSFVEVNPYLSIPIMKGYVNGYSFVDYSEPTQREMALEKKALLTDGVDILLGDVNQDFILSLGLNKDTYSPVKYFTCNRVWKNRDAYRDFLLYCTNEVKDNLNEMIQSGDRENDGVEKDIQKR